ncbi:MAG: ParB family transcriptional regulator, chromosome partitioning protein [Clostridiales bacterium]|jgi:ParB family chromosome partitioning protein|nr:ParB family transcriptional regulator, chromosome partitioning protein [Clostridiales bacterium]MDN5281863.1 ParB family transcriptional regulator, chromosome partitioning protein [Candidatus Ozemobacter sp.]
MLNLAEKYADNSQKSDTPNGANNQMQFRLLELEKVKPNPDQPRKIFDKQALEELAQSIRENGVLQPILVRQQGDCYQIVSGERRYRASRLAGLKYIPAVIRKLSEEQTLLAGLIENIQRQDLNPVEEARTLKDILLNFGLTHDQLAERVGRSRSSLTNRLRLLQLPYDVQLLIIEGKISAGHAKMLAGMKDPIEIKTWARRIIKEQLSVYETEKQIAQSKRNLLENLNKKGKKSKMSSDLHVRAVEENLQELLGAKVRIRQGKSKGRIEIEFYDRSDLERVVESMVSMYL